MLDYELTLVPNAARLDGVLHLPPGEHRIETATWVPGAYAFLRYGRDLFDVRNDQGPLPRAGYTGFRGAGAVRFSAQLTDPTWTELAGLITADHAIVHATRLPFVRGYEGPVRVRWHLPAGWPMHHPAGATVDGDVVTYPSFAVFLDTPLVCGSFAEIVRDEDGVAFHHVCLERAIGQDSELDGFVDDVQKLARAAREVFGGFPFERYSFVWGFDSRAHWGLEHAHSTLVGVGPLALVDPEARFAALRVAAHELVHAWNVCRLKPAALAKPDLVNGSFPAELWIAEGFTRYYEFLLMVRAGLCSPTRFFSNIVRYYQALGECPAYAFTSPVDSSCATFVNHTRYPNAPNAMIDYYDAGLLVAFDLDVQLQLGGSSLDVAFRQLYGRYGQAPAGFTHEQACDLFAELGVDARAETEHAGALTTVTQLERLGFTVSRREIPKLGVVLDDDRVVHVLAGSAAERAALHADDRLLTHDDIAFSAQGLDWLINHASSFALTVRRGDRLVHTRVQPAPASEINSLHYAGDSRLLQRWLGQPLAHGGVPLTHYDNFHGTSRVV